MPVEIFYSYSHRDKMLCKQLTNHLFVLKRRGFISGWHDRDIDAGDEWRRQIDSHLNSAQIILLLISAEFVASDYCWDIEMRTALERHARGDAVVIPIILRPCNWKGTPFAELQVLPTDGKPVMSWQQRDAAFASIAEEISGIVSHFENKLADTQSALQVRPPTTQPRVLEAALPSHVVVDRVTELLVLIRRPESKGLAGILMEDEEVEAKPEDVRSKPFGIIFPTDAAGFPGPLRVTVDVTGPDFDPPSQRKNVLVPVNDDPEVCSFGLIPKRVGQLMVFVELQWQDTHHGNRRLRTTCNAESEPSAAPSYHLTQMPFEVAVARTPSRTYTRFESALAVSPEDPDSSSSHATATRRSLDAVADARTPKRDAVAHAGPPERVSRFNRTLLSYLLLTVFGGMILYIPFRWSSQRQSPVRTSDIKVTTTHWPEPGPAGPGSVGEIEGIVSGPYPEGACVLVYACLRNGDCFVQPSEKNYRVPIVNDRWRTSTHLGDYYVVLLVRSDFGEAPAAPPNPPSGEGVLATDEGPQSR